MARQCKCQICQKVLTTDMAYKVSKGSRNLYYCSEEEYKQLFKVQEDRDNCYYTAGRVMKVPYIPPSMRKEINELSKYYSFEIIERTFKANKEAIQRFLNNQYSASEYAKVRYIMTVIGNDINKIYTQYQAEQKAKAELFTKEKTQTIDVDIINNTKAVYDIPASDRKVTDISKWL